MGVTIRWSSPADTNWTFSRVYRAASRAGSYSLLASIAIGTYSYVDDGGSSSYWYKVSFYDGVNESSLSEAVQGNTTANYCSLSTLRNISPFSTNEISDTDVIALMPVVSRMIQRKITTKYKLERDLVGPIDGSNTIFYVKHPPIGDADMDSDVDTDDVQVFYATLDANNQRNYGSAKSVSSVDARGGRITMTTAPTTTTARDGLYITYYKTIEDIDYADVRLAANYLLAHYCSLKIKGEAPNFSQIEPGFLRSNVAGSIGLPYDAWKYPFLRSAINILNDIIGKGTDGVGFRRVDAEAN